MFNIRPLTLLFILSATMSHATPPATHSYDCQSSDGIYHVNYEEGQSLSLYGNRGTSGHFSMSQIEIGNSVMGNLLSVQLNYAPDSHSYNATFILPHVNFKPRPLPVPEHGFVNLTKKFNTVLVLTKIMTSIGGPSLVDGAIERSNYISLQCTASPTVR